MVRFYVGLPHPHQAYRFEAAFISVNALKRRKGDFQANDWIMDSGAFSTIKTHGGYPEPVSVYAGRIRRWSKIGNLQAAVSQDYMCEAEMLEITGLTVREHQRLTIQRYDDLANCDTAGIYIMPVLQGYAPEEYLQHLRQYGSRLPGGSWIGVGSVCKRNGSPAAVESVLRAIKSERPDLRLHGFGLKKTALHLENVRDLLFSADSMAWSSAARWEGRNSNDWREAERFARKMAQLPVQLQMVPTR